MKLMPPNPSGPASAPREAATLYLGRMARGDRGAAKRLFEVLYSELRSQAAAYLSRERVDHTLQPTALVHEAWIKLIEPAGLEARDQGHFMGIAAQAMRRILVDHARGKGRQKRGGGWERLDEQQLIAATADQAKLNEILAVNGVLEQLAADAPRMAQVVEMHFFAGLTREQIAEALDISRSTVARELRAARALLSRLLRERPGSGE